VWQQFSRLNPSVYSAALRGGCCVPPYVADVSIVNCEVCQQFNKRTLLLLLLLFEAQARACSKACFYHLLRIQQIKRFTDDSSLQLLVQAFTITRLNYCNGWLCVKEHGREKWGQRGQLPPLPQNND